MALGFLESSGSGGKTKNLMVKPKGTKEFCPMLPGVEKMVAFFEFFEHYIKEEWTNLVSHKQNPNLAKRHNSLPDQVKDLLQVPLVNALIVALFSSGLVTKDSKVSLHNQLDYALKSGMKP